MSTIGVKSCGSSLARYEGSEEPKMAGSGWFEIEAVFNKIRYSIGAFFPTNSFSYKGSSSRPIALAIRVLVGFKRECRRAGISYPRFAPEM